jgi:DNA-binding transcriptional LysR family regulator
MDHRFKKFLAVADTGSFSAAAKKLHVSQPAITLAIASLERAFGTKLYIRKKYAVELTEQGEIVAKTAKKISQEIEKMGAKLHEDAPSGQYQIGIIDSIAQLLYTSTKESQLLANVEVMVDNSKRILGDLAAERIDVGVITGQPTTLGKDVTVHKLHSEEFVFVCAPHVAPSTAVTHIDDWLAINQDSTSYKHFVKLFKRRGLVVTPIFYSTSMELLKGMAINGKGTALLPKHLVEENLDNGTLQVVKTKHLYRPIWAVMRKNEKPHTLHNLTTQVDKLLTEEV